jgi:hypothetical protein
VFWQWSLGRFLLLARVVLARAHKYLEDPWTVAVNNESPDFNGDIRPAGPEVADERSKLRRTGNSRSSPVGGHANRQLDDDRGAVAVNFGVERDGGSAPDYQGVQVGARAPELPSRGRSGHLAAPAACPAPSD